MKKRYKNENDLNGGVKVYFEPPFTTGNRRHDEVELYINGIFFFTTKIKNVYSLTEAAQKNNIEAKPSASDNSQMDAILALKKDGISAKDMHDVGWNGAINTVVNVLKRHH